ncbi:C-X-C chemokine receptor type 3-like [Protopterus annectens]|uniref:C-X-C chemokine receptor type 3-like n=1 Tax=Protopterus annectens TaxID=7888 RepID=UPI001CFA1B1C|nr:C-X-C chemokine receptor type 3-like [Protopterus annectens]
MTIDGSELIALLNSSDFEYVPNTSHISSLCNYDRSYTFDIIFFPIFYTVTFILGILGNGTVVAVLVKYRRKLVMTDVYILHLAIADILLVMTLPFWAANAVHGWVFGSLMCKIFGAAFKINFYCGIFLLVCISFERYLSIVHAIQMYKKRKTVSITITCLVVWIISIFMTLPDFIFLQGIFEERRNIFVCIHNFPAVTAKHWRITMRFIYHVIGFFIPLAIMFYCYILILRTLCQSPGCYRQRAVYVIIALVAVFFMSWAPYNITMLLDTLRLLGFAVQDCDNIWKLNIALSITVSLGYFHCCLNPFLSCLH